jgi:FkbM family methyltransferase
MTIPEFTYTVLCKPRPVRAVVNSLIRHVVPEAVERFGATVFLNPADPVVSGALTFNVYEKAETAFFTAVLGECMTVVDVGANVGYYSALALVRIGNGRLVAFEPSAETREYLKKTIQANSRGNAHIVPKAVSDSEGTATLFINEDNRGDNRLYDNALCSRSETIETVTLDSALASLGIESMDILKMDVQGFEGHVIRGMQQTVQRSPNLIVMSEFWPFGLTSAGSDPTAVLATFESWGLIVYELLTGCRVQPIHDKTAFIARYKGREYTNIVAARPHALPSAVAIVGVQ